MAEKPTPPASAPSTVDAPAAPVAAPAPATPAGRRTVTMPVVPLAIVGSVLVALILFGGGVAVGLAVGDHHARVGVIHPFNGRTGPFGGQNGFGPNGGQNGEPNGGRDGGFDGGFNGQPGGQPGQGGGQPGGQDGRPAPVPTPSPTNG